MSSSQSFIVADPLADWPEPDISILRLGRVAPPRFGNNYLPPFWSRFVSDVAESTGTPPDFVAMPLLAAASGLVGNSRWVQPWGGWTEPPTLWVATVGLPGSGKTPAAKPVFDVLAELESERFPEYEERLSLYRRDLEEYRQREDQWRGEVKEAVGANKPVPLLTDGEPERPTEPCLQANDSTLEKLCHILSGGPKGLLYRRDELSGWIESMNRYSSGGDRSFWLEAWSGGSYVVHRVKFDKPVRINRLAVPIFGTTQPAKIAGMLKDADDGLIPRLLWSMPDKRPFRRPTVTADTTAAKMALRRLAALQMDCAETDGMIPRVIPFSPTAAKVMEDFAAQMDRRLDAAAGLMIGIIAKARGQMARIALLLTYLEWAAGAGEEPTEVSADLAVMSANLVADYFLPMAARVLQDAALPQSERDAANVAKWIKAQGLTVINPREMERGVHDYYCTRDRGRIDEAMVVLKERAILADYPTPGVGGRPRQDYPVNPLFLEG